MPPETSFLIFNHTLDDVLYDLLMAAITSLLLASFVGYFFIRPYQEKLLLRIHRQSVLTQRNETDVSFSINSFEPQPDSTKQLLVIRPLADKRTIESLFHNRFLRTTFMDTVKACPVGQSVAVLPKGDAAILILGTIKTYVSKRFAVWFLLRALGYPVNVRKFLLFIVHEQEEDIPNRQVRIVFIEPGVLTNLPHPRQVIYEEPHHRRRLRTLLDMAEIYRNMDVKQKAANTLDIPIPQGIPLRVSGLLEG